MKTLKLLRYPIAFALFLCMAVGAGHAVAQVKKCIGPDGKVSYTDAPCAAGQRSTETLRAGSLVANTPAFQPIPAAPGAMRELDTAIAGHLAMGNIAHAKTLAVSKEQFQMIREAEQEKAAQVAEAKAAKRAARPTVCTTSGFSHGGAHSGVAICNK